MDTDSAGRQPPIDTTIVTDTCITCGSDRFRRLEGELRLRQCMGCGDLTIGEDHPLYTEPQLVIAGADLVAVIKASAEWWQRLKEIDELRRFGDIDFARSPGDPAWDVLYEQQVRELAAEIGELYIGGES